MENLKIITTDIFLEKFDNHTLENEDLEAIYFQKTFEDTNNSYWEEVRKDNFLGDIQEKNIYEWI